MGKVFVPDGDSVAERRNSSGVPDEGACCIRMAAGLYFGADGCICGTFGLYIVLCSAGEASYARPGEKRPACTTGVYALCRHPGVLWFAGLFACLWLAAGLPLQDAAVYTILNVLLVWFEDRCVFPDLLEGYEAYRASTPFLIPNGKSIRACIRGKV